MFDKLEAIEAKYEELTGQMGDPELLADPSKYAKVAKQHRDLEEVVAKFREYKAVENGIKDVRELLEIETDAEMVEMAQAELTELEAKLPTIEEALKVLLLPKDPNDEKNVILEIRAGTGGDEATLFA